MLEMETSYNLNNIHNTYTMRGIMKLNVTVPRGSKQLRFRTLSVEI